MSVQTEVAKYDVRDIRLADEGKRRTEWSERLAITPQQRPRLTLSTSYFHDFRTLHALVKANV